jgi:predicted transcriptional regulator
MIRVGSKVAAAALGVGLITATGAAGGQGVLNSIANFSLPTTAGATRSISQYRGRVVILFYEDRNSTSQNEHVKQAIARAHRADPQVTQQFALVPIANVGAYNFWPAEYFAREAITAVARANHVELWFDWDGQLIRSLRLRDNASNVVVLDRRGRVRYHRAGRVPDAEVASFVALLRQLAQEP